MKYRWIKKNIGIYPVTKMCKSMKVSKSGYYDWLKRKPSALKTRRKKLLKAVGYSYYRSKKIYGYRKVHKDLVKELKIDCCDETVRKIMRDNGMRSEVRKKYKVTTNSDHSLKKAENIIRRDFKAKRPNIKWAADITYIRTKEGWLYLAAVMDLYSRKIVGWSMSKRQDSGFVTDALKMAVSSRGRVKELIHHSDQGIQYCSKLYREELRKNGIKSSMSRTGDCWDNACMESFYGSLKTEWIKGRVYETREEARMDIFYYIEIFYNTQRRHESLGYVSPQEYEKREIVA